MFSIIIPLYNKEKEIKKTLDSVFNQTFKEFEIVVVNDGSKDNGVSIVNSYKDDRIRVIEQENQGVSAARNRGIKEAKNEWIAFLDADDIWASNHLETFNNAIVRYKNVLVYCNSYTRGKKIIRNQTKKEELLLIEDYFKEALKQGHFFWTSAACLHKKVFDNIGVFKESLSRGEDLDLWCRIGKNYSIIQSSNITAVYIQDSENKLSKSKSNLEKSILSTINFSKIKGSEKKYFKYLIKKRLKIAFKKKEWNIFFGLIGKYHIYVF